MVVAASAGIERTGGVIPVLRRGWMGEGARGEMGCVGMRLYHDDGMCGGGEVYALAAVDALRRRRWGVLRYWSIRRWWTAPNEQFAPASVVSGGSCRCYTES